jgi:hypothetical protein
MARDRHTTPRGGVSGPPVPRNCHCHIYRDVAAWQCAILSHSDPAPPPSHPRCAACPPFRPTTDFCNLHARSQPPHQPSSLASAHPPFQPTIHPVTRQFLACLTISPSHFQLPSLLPERPHASASPPPKGHTPSDLNLGLDVGRSMFASARFHIPPLRLSAPAPRALKPVQKRMETYQHVRLPPPGRDG